MADEEENYCPIEQVRLTVPQTDDPTESVLTFRTWFLGLASCVVLSFANQFFSYRESSLQTSAVAAQIVTLPLGKLMARVLPTWKFRMPGTKWSFSLNPGPFSLKEHVLITILANCGSSGVYAVGIVTIVRALYHRPLHPLAGFILAQTTQMLGYGWAGIFRKFLVDSPFMWWPDTLVTISLFRALHENDTRKKGGLSRLQFFLAIFVCSFAYYIVPGYLFPSIGFISILCIVWKDSVLAHQLGGARTGMGILSFGLDWSTVVSFTGNPIAAPGFAIINTLVGFFLTTYVILPLMYFNNVYEAKRFPILSSKTFDYDGHIYDIPRVLNNATFSIDMGNYLGYSKLYLSVFFAFTYGLGFSSLTASIVHVALYHGKEIWSLSTQAKNTLKEKVDVHTRIMRQNYKMVPEWWFHVILFLTFALSIYACHGFNRQLQLPWWALILAAVMAVFFTLPVGIIQATTNNQIGLNIITEMVIGFILPGKPLANVSFKTYSYISMSQALGFLADFKLGHYMKIPPRSMFVAQLVGTVVASSVYFATAWWLLSTIPNICNKDLLPEGSPWTCPSDNVFYSASVIWGIIGPLRMFGKLGIYFHQMWWFLVGAVAPIPAYLLSKKYPDKKWLALINMPLILSGTGGMPPAGPVNFLMWGIVGIFFNFYIFRVNKKWWARHAYVMAAALNAGISISGILIFFTLQNYGLEGPNWWGLAANDHCPLARCPTAPGVKVEGCPVF